jgi:DNA-binding response OmpR family regulator
VPPQHRILLVDDESNVCYALAELLRDEGFAVAIAVNGADAVDKVASFQPQVLISDLELPGMEAIELVRRLQDMPDAPVVIALASFGQTSQGVAALHAGAMSYLAKPIRFDELLVILTKALRLFDMGQELRSLRQRESHTLAS